MNIGRLVQLIEAQQNKKVLNSTGAAALAASLTATYGINITDVRIHLSAAGGAGNLTIKINAIAGAAYDTTLVTQDMTGVTDYVWQPTSPLYLQQGDVLEIAWLNANNRTYGLTVVYTEVA